MEEYHSSISRGCRFSVLRRCLHCRELARSISNDFKSEAVVAPSSWCACLGEGTNEGQAMWNHDQARHAELCPSWLSGQLSLLSPAFCTLCHKGIEASLKQCGKDSSNLKTWLLESLNKLTVFDKKPEFRKQLLMVENSLQAIGNG